MKNNKFHFNYDATTKCLFHLIPKLIRLIPVSRDLLLSFQYNCEKLFLICTCHSNRVKENEYEMKR